MGSPIGKLLRASGIADRYLRGGEELPPVVRGLGPSWIPEPQKFFISFGRTISTSRYRRRVDDPAAMRELRSRVAASIEAQFETLQRMQRDANGEISDAHRVGASDWRELVAGLFDRPGRQLLLR